LAFVAFALLNAYQGYSWDGFQIWATKAQVLFQEGSLGRKRWRETEDLGRLAAYPPLVPLFEALLALLRGGFEFDRVRAVFVPFFLALLVATYNAARRIASKRVALAATALFAFLPAISGRHNAGGYADMPMAAYLAACLAALLAQERAPQRLGAIVWLLGGLLLVKSEGMALVWITALAILVGASRAGLSGAREGIRRAWPAAAVLLLLIALRLTFISWIDAPPNHYGWDRAHWAAAVGRVPQVARLCLQKLFAWRDWGLF
jgi:asparagine N-glycosylation enzyme membrane subunit Stt3